MMIVIFSLFDFLTLFIKITKITKHYLANKSENEKCNFAAIISPVIDFICLYCKYSNLKIYKFM